MSNKLTFAIEQSIKALIDRFNNNLFEIIFETHEQTDIKSVGVQQYVEFAKFKIEHYIGQKSRKFINILQVYSTAND